MNRKLSSAALDFFKKEGAKGGKIGGKKRLLTMTPDRRSEVARKAAFARWGRTGAISKAGQQSSEKANAILSRGQGIGQAAAAEANLQRDRRLRIIQALEQVRIPHDSWPDFVVDYHSASSKQREYRQRISVASFQPPAFDRLNQSAEEWKKAADDAWQLHRDGFLKRCELWVATGVDEAIAPAKPVRGTGRTTRQAVVRKRGDNTSVDRRYEWAAKYLCSVPLKEIGAAELADASTVGRIARRILRLAGWKRKKKTSRPAS